jgi:hypothetical protein
MSNLNDTDITATVASSTALRLRCLAQCIHALGPRPLFELMCELVGSSIAMDRFERIGAATLPAPARLACVSDDRKPRRPVLRLVK